MDDRVTALRNRPGAHVHGRARARSRRRVEAHHRRRRLVALGVVAFLALIVGANAGSSSGGGGTAVQAQAHAPVSAYFVRLNTLGGVGPGSFAGEEKAAENAAINRTLARTPYVQVAGSQHREIALTFDDGPGPYTPQVLADPAARRRAGHVLRGRDLGAVLPRLDLGDRRRRLSDRRPHREPLRDVAPVLRGPEVAAASADLHDRPLRRSLPATVPSALRPLGRHHAQAAQAVPHADGAVDGRHERLHAARRRRDRPHGRLWGPARSRSSSCTTPAATAPRPSPRSRRSSPTLRKRGYRFVTVPKLLLDNPAPSNQQAVTGAG